MFLVVLHETEREHLGDHVEEEDPKIVTPPPPPAVE